MISNTLVYVVVTVPISVVLALILALLLNRKFRALGLYRLAFFYPSRAADGQRGDDLAVHVHARATG